MTRSCELSEIATDSSVVILIKVGSCSGWSTAIYKLWHLKWQHEAAIYCRLEYSSQGSVMGIESASVRLAIQ